ncbi:hypothetical protein ACFVFQ_37455, partial [Streptomyces sp. NPDC057743]|uniref:hypothetical protein n=1 Tax=Streptomyces sp. NPDC057743 TaxID=3346236 RepID=UPI003673AE09
WDVRHPAQQSESLACYGPPTIPRSVAELKKFTGGHRFNHELASGFADALDSHIGPRERHILDRLDHHAAEHQAETFVRSRP